MTEVRRNRTTAGMLVSSWMATGWETNRRKSFRRLATGRRNFPKGTKPRLRGIKAYGSHSLQQQASNLTVSHITVTKLFAELWNPSRLRYGFRWSRMWGLDQKEVARGKLMDEPWEGKSMRPQFGPLAKHREALNIPCRSQVNGGKKFIACVLKSFLDPICSQFAAPSVHR